MKRRNAEYLRGEKKGGKKRKDKEKKKKGKENILNGARSNDM